MAISAQDVHLVRMNCGGYSHYDLEAKYQHTLAVIEEKESEITHLREMLGLLEAEHIRRNGGAQ